MRGDFHCLKRAGKVFQRRQPLAGDGARTQGTVGAPRPILFIFAAKCLLRKQKSELGPQPGTNTSPFQLNIVNISNDGWILSPVIF